MNYKAETKYNREAMRMLLSNVLHDRIQIGIGHLQEGKTNGDTNLRLATRTPFAALLNLELEAEMMNNECDESIANISTRGYVKDNCITGL